ANTASPPASIYRSRLGGEHGLRDQRTVVSRGRPAAQAAPTAKPQLASPRPDPSTLTFAERQAKFTASPGASAVGQAQKRASSDSGVPANANGRSINMLHSGRQQQPQQPMDQRTVGHVRQPQQQAEGRVYPPAGIAPVSQAPQGFNYAPSSRGEGRLGRARVLRRPAVPTPKEHLFLARPVAHQWSQSQGPHARLTKHGAPQPVVSSLECLLPIGTLLLNRLPKGRWRQVQLEPIQTLGAKVQLQPFRAGNRSALVAQRHLVTSWLLLVMLSRLSAWQCNSRA
ncbi:unnamed protein product, partial [Polarella glacialis]